MKCLLVLLLVTTTTLLVIGGAENEPPPASVTNISSNAKMESRPCNQTLTLNDTSSTQLIPDDELRKIIKMPVGYDKDPHSRVIEDNQAKISYYIDGHIENVVFLEDSQECNVTLRLQITWSDWRLHFRDNRSRPTEITHPVFAKLWRPRPFIKYLTTTGMMLPESFNWGKVVMFPDKQKSCKGCARFSVTLRGLVVVPVKVDYRFYPNDRHETLFEFRRGGPASLSNVDFNFEESNGNDDIYLHPTYYISVSSARLEEHKKRGKDAFSGRLADIDMRIVFSRKMSAHLIRNYIPCGFFVMLGYLSLLLPPQLAEARVTLTTGILLTITIFFNTASQLGPSVTYLRAFDIWLLGTITFVFFMLIENIVVLRVAGISNKATNSDDVKMRSAMEDILKLHASPVKMDISEGQNEKPKKSASKNMNSEDPDNNGRIMSRGIMVAKYVDKLSIVIFILGILTFDVIYWCWLLISPQTPCDWDPVECAKVYFKK